MKGFLLILSIAFAINSNAQIISTIAGTGTAGYTGDGGPATAATISDIQQLNVDKYGNLYVADLGNYCIRKISTSGIITTVAGTGSGGYTGDGGPATLATLYQPRHVTFDTSGNMYIADSWNNAVRMVNNSGVISTIAGTGSAGSTGDGGLATAALLDNPYSIAVDKTGNVYIADRGNNRVRMIDGTGVISTVAGTGAAGFAGDGGPATSAQFTYITSIALDTAGNLFIADDGNNRIRMVSASSGIVSTIAGIGTSGYSGDGGLATLAEFDGMDEIIFDSKGNLFIDDEYNFAIRMINTSGIVSTVAGNNSAGFSGDGGPALAAQLNYPRGVAVDGMGNIYISEWNDNRIRFVCNSPDTISGLITEPNANPINAGKVFVFRQNLTHAGLLDTAGYALINANGTYSFPNLPYGNYFVEAIADTSVYGNSVGTYYSTKTDNYRWDSAIFVSHAGCSNNAFAAYNITVIEPAAQTGTGVISGTVYTDVGFGQKMSGGNNTVLGAPLKGVDIKLGKNPGGCAAKTSTSSTGTYTFTNVDIGNYFVYVDVPNYIDTIVNISITSGSQTSLNIDYCIDSAKVKFCGSFTNHIQSALKEAQLTVYPNPTANMVTIQSPSELGAVVIYNSFGEMIFHTDSKNRQEQIDVAKLPAGVYSIQTNGKYLKFVKE